MRHEENDLRKSCMLWSVLVSITQQKKVMINCLVSENIILSTLNTFFYLVVEPLKCRGGGVYLDLSDSTIKKSIFMCAFPYHFHLDFLHVYFYLIKHWESSELLCVPRKGFGSAVCDTIHFSVHKQLIWTFFEAHIVSNEELKIHRMSVCVKITLIHHCNLHVFGCSTFCLLETHELSPKTFSKTNIIGRIGVLEFCIYRKVNCMYVQRVGGGGWAVIFACIPL